MNEIKLIEEIEDAIHNKKYDELLYKVEFSMKHAYLFDIRNNFLPYN